eukprot:TRINITY_DN3177_c1_g1_i3.p1 TRINITY_DN3177_c1_g1~~TRINITY_DN3177_c1_g1_i3.p1  ORF type:complete len:635 (-),score=71.82 TRINITY_DN3177_c1_g1_i3:23-1882(-)
MYPVHVVNVMWSLGKAAQYLRFHKVYPEFFQIFNELIAKAISIRSQFSPQQLSLVLWSMSRVKWQNWKQIKPIMDQIHKITIRQKYYNSNIPKSDNIDQQYQFNRDKRYNYTASDVATLLWSLAGLKCMDLHIIGHIVNMCKMRVEHLNAQEIAVVMWSLKQLRFFDCELFVNIEQEIALRKLKFNSQNISNIFLALGAFRRHGNGPLILNLVDQFLEIQKYDSQHICNVIYSLAVMKCSTWLVQEVVDKLIWESRHNYSKFNREELCQLRYAYLLYEHSDLNNLQYPELLLQKCTQAMQELARNGREIENSIIPKVLKVVQSRYPQAQQRVLICNNEFQAHISVYGYQEADGKLSNQQFYQNQSQQLGAGNQKIIQTKQNLEFVQNQQQYENNQKVDSEQFQIRNQEADQQLSNQQQLQKQNQFKNENLYSRQYEKIVNNNPKQGSNQLIQIQQNQEAGEKLTAQQFQQNQNQFLSGHQEIILKDNNEEVSSTYQQYDQEQNKQQLLQIQQNQEATQKLVQNSLQTQQLNQQLNNNSGTLQLEQQYQSYFEQQQSLRLEVDQKLKYSQHFSQQQNIQQNNSRLPQKYQSLLFELNPRERKKIQRGKNIKQEKQKERRR